MSKKKTSKRSPPQPPPDSDADLHNWKRTMLDVYVPNAASEAETRHVKMHIEITHHLASEVRAVRRAIEGGVK